MKITAIIPAKGHSSRLPNKNIKEINGKPMLYWAIKACLDSKYDIDIWVSSDSEEILKIAKENGAHIYKRSLQLCGDFVFKQEVIRDVMRHICETSNYEDIPQIVISLQPNSPQIRSEHLDYGIDTLIKYDRNEIFSVDKNLMQNGAFRIMKKEYVFQNDLSTYCGVVICDIVDIHDEEDVKTIKETKWK